MTRTNWILAVMAIVTLGFATESQARNSLEMWPVADALDSSHAQGKFAGDIQFFFGDGNHPDVEREIGNWVSNKKTNAFNKSDEEACQIAFLSALISLQKRARSEGGNAVINIVSYYKKNRTSSETEFECGAGNVVAGVALQGDVVVLE